MTFEVKLLYHPVLHVPSLEEAEDFYARVFGRPSTNLSVIMPQAPAPGHSNDHSVFTLIGDVFLDTLQPSRYITGGRQRYPSVRQPALSNPGGWYVKGVKELYRELREQGFRLVNARDELLEEPDWPGGWSPFYSHPEDTGLRYAFFEVFPFPLDERLQEGWTVPEPPADDPIGVHEAAFHTILTPWPERAQSLLVGVLGGEVIGSGRDELRAVTGDYVRLAGSVFHLATPDPGVEIGPLDRYHAITWRVGDLDRAARHLQSQGVGVQHRSETALVTDPATSLGVPWGFTTEATMGESR